MDDERKLLFLHEYQELCIKHQISIDGCGCCGSPFLVDLEQDELLGYSGDFKKVNFDEERWHSSGGIQDAMVFDADGNIRVARRFDADGNIVDEEGNNAYYEGAVRGSS